MDGELTAKLKITVFMVTLTIMLTLMNCSGPDAPKHLPGSGKVSAISTAR